MFICLCCYFSHFIFSILQFLPNYPSTLAVLSRSGFLRFMDAESNLAAKSMSCQVSFMCSCIYSWSSVISLWISSVYVAPPQISSPALSCMEISASGDCLFFGDELGVVHLWSEEDVCLEFLLSRKNICTDSVLVSTPWSRIPC